MHRNHRRHEPRRARHIYRLKVRLGCFKKRSLKYYRKQRASDRRAEERRLLHHQQWDNLPTRYPKNVLWDAY